jgi:hypothetical protein
MSAARGWYPKVEDLQLPTVPEEVRPRIRKRLEPWLQTLQDQGFGVKVGDCYAVAQALVTLIGFSGHDPRTVERQSSSLG